MASKYFDLIEISPAAQLFVDRMFRRLDRAYERQAKAKKAQEKKAAH